MTTHQIIPTHLSGLPNMIIAISNSSYFCTLFILYRLMFTRYYKSRTYHVEIREPYGQFCLELFLNRFTHQHTYYTRSILGLPQRLTVAENVLTILHKNILIHKRQKACTALQPVLLYFFSGSPFTHMHNKKYLVLQTLIQDFSSWCVDKCQHCIDKLLF